VHFQSDQSGGKDLSQSENFEMKDWKLILGKLDLVRLGEFFKLQKFCIIKSDRDTGTVIENLSTRGRHHCTS